MQWETLSDLTAEGMQQLYKVGQKLREKYITNETLIPPEYDYNTVYARASARDRCLQSGQSLLLGLYPIVSDSSQNKNTYHNSLPSSFQMVPINTVNKDRDVLLRGYQLWFVTSFSLAFFLFF